MYAAYSCSSLARRPNGVSGFGSRELRRRTFQRFALRFKPLTSLWADGADAALTCARDGGAQFVNLRTGFNDAAREDIYSYSIRRAPVTARLVFDDRGS
ncbi:hypothetical protein EVAR_99440_1 [Eumeta japonica]|uniref:Uncharacterized protein n=1 Tax=Eumeta variegata TaxID=151549 RepID=A0A4C1Z962_EUMVA|nr:hypothetical protein EVAR_99440_1 [Eumeta japonica]